MKLLKHFTILQALSKWIAGCRSYSYWCLCVTPSFSISFVFVCSSVVQWGLGDREGVWATKSREKLKHFLPLWC